LICWVTLRGWLCSRCFGRMEDAMWKMEWLLRTRYLYVAPLLSSCSGSRRWLGKRRAASSTWRGGTPAPGPTPSQRTRERTVAPAPSPPQPLTEDVLVNSFDRTFFEFTHAAASDNSGTGTPTSSRAAGCSQQHKSRDPRRSPLGLNRLAQPCPVDRGRSAGCSGMMHLADMCLGKTSTLLK
jgi:hypothetical protein